jgi:hypothetical protein
LTDRNSAASKVDIGCHQYGRERQKKRRPLRFLSAEYSMLSAT